MEETFKGVVKNARLNFQHNFQRASFDRPSNYFAHSYKVQLNQPFYQHFIPNGI